MKAQSTIEFLGGMILFLSVIVGALVVTTEDIPKFTEGVGETSQYLEMYRFTNQMLSNPGKHEYGSTGTNWEKNASTIKEISEFGIAEKDHLVSKNKIDNLSTVGQDSLNYSKFREIESLKNQYYLNFTLFPIVETSSKFKNSRPPSNPPITEPDSSSPDYSLSDDITHYGNINLFGNQYNFLVVSFSGVFNTTYISESNWDFENSPPKAEGDIVSLSGNDYRIEKIQNRERIPGSSVILKRNLNSFGPSPLNTAENVNKLNRYAVLNASNTEKQIVRIEVLSW